MWTVLLAASAACYLLKLSGMVIPERFLKNPRIRHIVELLPVALLAALIAVQVLAGNQALVVDARLPGLLTAIVAVRLKALFLLVIAIACTSTALFRLWG